VNIIDQCVAQGVPFAREYGGLLDNRSFGGAQVSAPSTPAARPASSCCSAPTSSSPARSALGNGQAVQRAPRCSTWSWSTAWRRHRDPRPGHRRGHEPLRPRRGAGHRRLRQRLLPLHQRHGCNVTAAWRAHRGARFANPCYTQIHPTCIPVSDDYQSKLTLMSESLRNDGRIWVPQEPRRQRPAARSPRRSATTTWSGVPELRQPGAPRHRQPRGQGRVRRGPRRGPARERRLPRLRRRHRPPRREDPKERYGNLFEMYERITGENPYKVPMRIYPAVHYTMGGLWVDYNLMTTIPGLYAAGEANFSATTAPTGWAPARSCRAWPTATSCCPTPSATTWHPQLAPVDTDHPEFRRRGRGHRQRFGLPLASAAPARPTLPPRAGQDHVGLLRHGAHQAGLRRRWSEIPALREEFWKDLRVTGSGAELNQTLEKAGRVATSSSSGAHVPRRPHPRGELRRPLPRRAPDRGGRGRSATTSTSPTSAPGSGPGTPCPVRTRSPSSSRRPPRHPELQVSMNI
jgi:succinate dehydrogenase / fumarate reductase flavoprotein subunit